MPEINIDRRNSASSVRTLGSPVESRPREARQFGRIRAKDDDFTRGPLIFQARIFPKQQAALILGSLPPRVALPGETNLLFHIGQSGLLNKLLKHSCQGFEGRNRVNGLKQRDLR